MYLCLLNLLVTKPSLDARDILGVYSLSVMITIGLKSIIVLQTYMPCIGEALGDHSTLSGSSKTDRNCLLNVLLKGFEWLMCEIVCKDFAYAADAYVNNKVLKCVGEVHMILKK